MSLKLQLGLQQSNLREVTKQDCDILRGQIADKVGSEVTEAILALDREEPNIEIALRRLRHIQKILYVLTQDLRR